MRRHNLDQIRQATARTQSILDSLMGQLRRYPTQPGPEQEGADTSIRVRAEHAAEAAAHLQGMARLHTEPATSSSTVRPERDAA